MATPPSPTPDLTPEPATVSMIGRITGVLFNPKGTFEDIGAMPNWVPPMLVMIVVSLALSVVLGLRVDWYQFTRHNIEKSPKASAQFDKLKPEAQDEAYRQQAAITKTVRYVRGVIGTPFLALFLAAIYLAAFNLIASTRATFITTFAFVTYSLLPVAIRELLAIPVVLLKDPGSIDPENIVASNLAVFLPGDAPLWLVTLCGSIDLFGLWSATLVAIAFSAAFPKKVSLGKALGIVFGIYVTFTLLAVGLVGAFT
jgi:hypothetical protein